MGSIYNQLTAGERTTLMVMRSEGASQSFVAEYLGRDRSTICRELARNGGTRVAGYDAILADARARDLRAAPGTNPKLGPDTPLFAVVHDQLREGCYLHLNRRERCENQSVIRGMRGYI